METTQVTIAVAGTGEDAEAVAHSLRGVAGVEVTRITGASEEELNDQLSDGDVDAIAFVTPIVDLAGSVRRTLMANRHAMIIGPAALSSKQLISLEELARRRSRVVLFDAGYAGDERIGFIRKMTASPAAIWRPRYLRAIRTGADRHTLDEIAIAEIETVLSIMGAAPSRVSAVAPRIDDETGHADAAMLTLTFDGGPVATVEVSLVEPMPRRELTIACDGRTIVLDAYDARTPLQIHAAGRHSGPQAGRAWSETVSEYPASSATDRGATVAATFVAAMRARDVAAINLRDFALAASAWEAARESIASGGEQRPIAGAAGEQRPELHVIQGGGRSEAITPPPELTLVRSRGG